MDRLSKIFLIALFLVYIITIGTGLIVQFSELTFLQALSVVLRALFLGVATGLIIRIINTKNDDMDENVEEKLKVVKKLTENEMDGKLLWILNERAENYLLCWFEKWSDTRGPAGSMIFKTLDIDDLKSPLNTPGYLSAKLSEHIANIKKQT